MKKLLLIFSFVSFYFLNSAQTTLYQNLKALIAEKRPDISTENRLIAFNVWSIDNPESREANKAFEKVYGVYENARLKGGSKGIIVIAVNKDNLSAEAVVTIAKDDVVKTISVKLSEIAGIDPDTANSIFDSNGNEVYKNLNSQAVNSSIAHLITR
jgi:hypothetical protein